jgi:biotin synthase
MMLTQKQEQKQDHPEIKHDWHKAEVMALFELPFNDLLFRAQSLHRDFFDANEIQLSALLNIKEGGCPEDCAYCSQSARHDTTIKAKPMLPLEQVIMAARDAQAQGASRFCMGAAWRSPRKKDFKQMLEAVSAVKSLGLETCATLGMLTAEQALELKQAGLDFYNHNLDTSPEYYQQIISTRTYGDRLQTLEYVRNAGLNVCCGGIIGMGEDMADRAELLRTLANLPQHPESVPINMLIKVEGTPLAEKDDLDPFDLVRTIAAARIMMPASYVRLSAGRSAMSDALQALCFHAGANSIFYGNMLLTAENPEHQQDKALFKRLGLREKREIKSEHPAACAHH